MEDTRSNYAGMRDGDRVIYADGRCGTVLDFNSGMAQVDFDADPQTKLVDAASLRPMREGAVVHAADAHARALALLDELVNILNSKVGIELDHSAWERLLAHAPGSAEKSVQYHYHLASGQRLSQVGDNVLVEPIVALLEAGAISVEDATGKTLRESLEPE